MLSLTIQWAPFSLKALNKAFKYILENSDSEKIAQNFIIKILQALNKASKRPTIFPPEPFLKIIAQNSRYVLIGRYKIIYQFTSEKINSYRCFSYKTKST